MTESAIYLQVNLQSSHGNDLLAGHPLTPTLYCTRPLLPDNILEHHTTPGAFINQGPSGAANLPTSTPPNQQNHLLFSFDPYSLLLATGLIRQLIYHRWRS